VKNRQIQFSQGVQSDDGIFKQSAIAPVLAPFVVMIVDRLPGNLFPVRTKFVPLHSGAQHIQNVVEYLVVRDFRLSALGFREAGFDEGVELVLRHLPWQFVVVIRF